eukprot:575578-Pyramimonas_sp.AAC.2
MLCIEEQLRREGLGVSMSDLLSEAAFAGNSFMFHGAQPRANIDSEGNSGCCRACWHSRMTQQGRASKTDAAVAGRTLDYKPGEFVDFCRAPSTRSVSGWSGPAAVAKVNATGIVTLNY